MPGGSGWKHPKKASDFARIARHVPALRLVSARFDPRQIGPRLPPAAPRVLRSSLNASHWHDFRALITHGRRCSREGRGAKAFAPVRPSNQSTGPICPRQCGVGSCPDRRGPIYQRSECREPLACRLAASRNRVGHSPTGGPLLRPYDQSRRVNSGKKFPLNP